MSEATGLPDRTRVLIVGAGPVGLTASALLSLQGIEHVVVERRRDTIRAPAAHVLRPRTMAVFERLGVADEIRRTAPLTALDFITWCTTLGGSEVGRLDAHADGSEGLGWTHYPQNLLEPLLLARARRARAATLLRGLCFEGLGQDEASVHVRLRDASGRAHGLEAAWLIAADGAGSAVRRALDVPMVGPGPQGRFFMVHVEADLRPWIEGRPGPLFWILHPGAAGTLIVHDPARSHVFMTLNHGTEGEEATLPSRLAAALAVDVELRILSVDVWSPHVQVAERYREGRVLLAGDAAHRFPPTGGLGLNTGILDVELLVHLLARVEAGRVDASCLDLYERECRPIAQSNAEASFENMKRVAEIGRAIGLCPDLAALEARLASLTPAERRQLDQAIELQRSHFASHGRLPRDPASLLP